MEPTPTARRRVDPARWMAAALPSLLLAALLGCGGNISNSDWRAGVGAVAGRLVYSDGRPANSALVQIVGLPALRAATGADGTFVIGEVPAGKRFVLAMDAAGNHGGKWETLVVRGRTVSLEKCVVLPSGRLTGSVVARSRFGNKGIKAQIVGTSIPQTITDGDGRFTFSKLPPGCHDLLFTVHLFQQRQVSVCVRPGENKAMDKPVELQASHSCRSGESECPDGSVCVDGSCVPDDGGTAVLSVSSLDLGAHPMLQQARRTVRLSNTGVGPLRVREITIRSGAPGLFEVVGPSLPQVLASGSELAVDVIFNARKLGPSTASLDIVTNDPDQPVGRVGLRGEGLAHSADCLRAVEPDSSSGEMALGDQRTSKVTMVNVCGRRLVLSRPETVLQTPGKLQVSPMESKVLEPGCSAEYGLKLVPEAYGAVVGKLIVRHDERSGAALETEIKARVRIPGIALFPSTLDFGSVPPGASRTLHLRVEWTGQGKGTGWAQPELRATTDQPAPSGSGVKRRSASGSSDAFRTVGEPIPAGSSTREAYFVPVRFIAPVTHRTRSAGLIYLGGLPGLGGKQVAVRTSGWTRAEGYGVYPATLDLGSPRACAAVELPITVSNPTSRTLEITSVSTDGGPAPGVLIRLVSEAPVVIPPGKSMIVAQATFTGDRAAFRSLGAFRLDGKGDADGLFPAVVPFTASSQIPRTEVHYQPQGREADILFVVDTGKGLSILHGKAAAAFARFPSELKGRGVDYRISVIGTDFADAAGAGNGGVGPNDPDADSTLGRLLRPPPSTPGKPDGGAFSAASLFLSAARPPFHRSGATLLVVFVAEGDDRSPGAVDAYVESFLHWSSAPALPAVISAVAPGGTCQGGRADRFIKAVRASGGHFLDLCKDDTPTRWFAWARRLADIASGGRTAFQLKRPAEPGTLSVSVAGKTIAPTLWHYDPNGHQVVFGSAATPEAGAAVSVSYNTLCGE